jgi:hypothetical protein
LVDQSTLAVHSLQHAIEVGSAAQAMNQKRPNNVNNPKPEA